MISGAKLRKIRLERNLTTKELADKVMEPDSVIENIENNTVIPSEELLILFRKALNCELSDFEEDPVVEEKKAIGHCSKCNKEFFSEDEIFIYNKESNEGEKLTLCRSCYDEQIQKEQEEKTLIENKRRTSIKVKRAHALIWPTLLVITFYVLTFKYLNLLILVGGILLFTFAGTLIFNNTKFGSRLASYIKWWLYVMPLNSIKDKKAFVKVLLFIASFLGGLLMTILILALHIILSLGYYLVALIKNLRYKA